MKRSFEMCSGCPRKKKVYHRAREIGFVCFDGDFDFGSVYYDAYNNGVLRPCWYEKNTDDSLAIYVDLSGKICTYSHGVVDNSGATVPECMWNQMDVPKDCDRYPDYFLKELQ